MTPTVSTPSEGACESRKFNIKYFSYPLHNITKLHLFQTPRPLLLVTMATKSTFFVCFLFKMVKFGNSDLIFDFRAPYEKCCCNSFDLLVSKE